MKIMNKSQLVMLTLLTCLFLNGIELVGFDDLFEQKLRQTEAFKPGKHWTYLGFDKSFVLDFKEPESFIKRATCLKIRDGKLYILDNNRHKLLIFDRDGNFIEKFGEIGRGPGDIYYPYWMEMCGDHIYILNNNGLDVFKGNLKFVDRLRSFLPIKRFSIDGDYIYCDIRGGGTYRERHPLFLKLNMHGGVEEAVYSEDLKDTLFRESKDGYMITVDNRVIFVSRHWNRIYFYEKSTKSLKKIRIKYGLLDKIEEWNKRNNDRKYRHVRWFSNMIASAKVFKGRLYLFLKIPRLEIIGIDTEGNIREHYVNDEDFQFMRWYDFAIEEVDGTLFFYVMGFSIGDRTKRDLTDFSVHRVMVPREKDHGIKTL